MKLPAEYKGVKVQVTDKVPHVDDKYYAIWTVDQKTLKPTIHIDPPVAEGWKNGTIPAKDMNVTLEHEYQEVTISLERALAQYPRPKLKSMPRKDFDDLLNDIGGNVHLELAAKHPKGTVGYHRNAFKMWELAYPKVRTAKPAPVSFAQTGVMIAFSPSVDVAQQLVLPDGLPLDELHCTFAYLGKASELDQRALKELPNLVREWASDKAPIPVTIAGIGRFSGDTNGDPLIALVDSPRLTKERPSLLKLLKVAGIPASETHGYTAHITLSYLTSDETYKLRKPSRIVTQFTHVEVHIAGKVTKIPLWEKSLSKRLRNLATGG
jgi:2'-5' RNA ligase